MRVSDDFFWAKGATGTISAPPDAVTSLSGAWDEALTRQEVSALGTHTVYWVWFDEPQFDANGDGPYSGGQIWESALSLQTERPNKLLTCDLNERNDDVSTMMAGESWQGRESRVMAFAKASPAVPLIQPLQLRLCRLLT